MTVTGILEIRPVLISISSSGRVKQARVYANASAVAGFAVH
jgi:hypothetical protein